MWILDRTQIFIHYTFSGLPFPHQSKGSAYPGCHRVARRINYVGGAKGFSDDRPTPALSMSLFLFYSAFDHAGKKTSQFQGKNLPGTEGTLVPLSSASRHLLSTSYVQVLGTRNESDESSSPKNKHPPPHPIFGWRQKEVKGSGAFKGGRPGFKSKLHHWDFPAGPVVKTPHSQCKGPRFDPWSGN